MANHADFTPDMKGYTGQGAFRFWCQKVLPLVYDDSLSYYELLNKVVLYLNNTISDVANVEDNVTALHEAYLSLQNFVNDYVDTLDFPAEVNRRLDEMASDGTLTTLILPYLPDIIGDWLAEHLTPTSPPVDDTLTIPNAAADAAAVGAMFDKTMASRGIIIDGADLDNFTDKGGSYYCARATAARVENGPWNNVAYVVFCRTGGTPGATSGFVQYAFSKNGGFAYRFYYAEEWFGWYYTANEDENPYLMMTRGTIAQGEDLDEYYVESGMYYVTRESASSIHSSPWDNDNYVIYIKNTADPNGSSGQAQFAFNRHGQFAMRMRYVNAWTDWAYIQDDSAAFKAMITRGSVHENDDLDAYYSMSGMWYCSNGVAETVQNTPWDNHGYALFVKASSDENSVSGQAQYAICYSGEFAWRLRYQNEWTDWHYAIDSSTDRLIMESRGSLPANSDLNDYYADSGMWYLSSTVAGNSQNVPWNDISSTLWVKASSSTTSPSGQTQLAISRHGDLAIRQRLQGVWSDWVYYAAKTETPLIAMSVFSRVAVIGASYDTGASPNVAGTASVPNPNNAWLRILSRKYGFYAGVYAYGGATIQSWYDPNSPGYSSCYGAFAADDPCELYFITMGGNGTIDGSIADCVAYDADPTSTPTTFYGYYSKLIHDIKTKAPNAAIVMCYPASTGIRGAFTDAIAAIDEIGEHYELPVLNQRSNPSWRRYGITLCATREGSSLHPTPLGHAMLAQTYDSVFTNVVMKYNEYFNTWRNEYVE